MHKAILSILRRELAVGFLGIEINSPSKCLWKWQNSLKSIQLCLYNSTKSVLLFCSSFKFFVWSSGNISSNSKGEMFATIIDLFGVYWQCLHFFFRPFADVARNYLFSTSSTICTRCLRVCFCIVIFAKADTSSLAWGFKCYVLHVVWRFVALWRGKSKIRTISRERIKAGFILAYQNKTLK